MMLSFMCCKKIYHQRDFAAGVLLLIMSLPAYANTPPTIGGTPPTSVDEDSTYSFTPQANDADAGDVLTFSIISRPSWASFDSATGTLSGTPTNQDVGTTSGITIIVTDSASDSAFLTPFAITVNNVNDAPTITGTPMTSVAEDSAYSFSPMANDIDVGDSFTFSISNKPAWASFDNNSGTLSGTPRNNDVGTTQGIVITVTDSGAASASLPAFDLQVINTNDAPTISGTAVTRAVSGQPYSNNGPMVSDVDVGDTLRFVIANQPVWASFDTTTGILSGTPTATDVGMTQDIVISVIDSHSASASLPAFDLTVVGDFDNDGVGDDVDNDIDGDGIDNDYETANGLDPWDPTDAALDADGDGRSNLYEFQLGKTAPVVTPPGVLTVAATGLLTLVDFEQIATASAVDALDSTLVVTPDLDPHLSPGRHIVTWRAVDAAGNEGSAEQVVEVQPLVDFSPDQSVAEGAAVTVPVYLNGPAPSYPVTIPFTVGGTANQGSDHDLVAGDVVINSGTEAEITFLTVNHAASSGFVKTVEIVMGTPTNAVLGSRDSHTVTLVESNLAPRVGLVARQQGKTTTVIVSDKGQVTVSAQMTDSDTSANHSYDWSASDNVLVDTDGEANTFSFDPLALAAGLYTLRLTVTDDGIPAESGEAELALNVLASAPNLASDQDSDGDGVSDADEGWSDSDNDGIADYQDSISARNVLQAKAGRDDRYLIETEPGLQLQLGVVALALGNNEAHVEVSDLLNYAPLSTEPDIVPNVGGLFDFKISALPLAGQTVKIVIPQFNAIPDDALYRKLTLQGWGDFVEDDNNSLASAPGEAGYCPPPGHSAYTPGLTAGDWCVQLTIEDGGPNDADGKRNNAIQDPGGVAKMLNLEVGSSGGGGVIDPLLVLLGIMITALNQYRRQKRHSVGSIM